MIVPVIAPQPAPQPASQPASMPIPASSVAPARPAPRGLRALLDRRILAATLLGFSSGMPFLLIYATQSAWFSEAHVAIGLLGLLSEMTFAYKLKFVWAPFLERHDAPLLGRLLGRRRGWIMASQLGVVACLLGIAAGDPAHRLGFTILCSLALGFCGASQDVTIDGWRITSAPPGGLALISSWGEVGWRVGTLAAGAGALYLSDAIGWHGAYLAMAGLMSIGITACLIAPEPQPRPDPEDAGTAGPATAPGTPPGTKARTGFGATIAAPIAELAHRLGRLAIPILLLVAGFRMPGYVSSAMAIPLYKHLHYTNSQIATVTKLFGFGIALAGTFLGSWMVPRLGLMATLLVGTVAGSASHLALAWLALQGAHGVPAFADFAIAVSIDNFAYAFASIVLITWMSALSADRHAASQYALLTSLCALPGSLIAGSSGLWVAKLGFAGFFATTSLIGLPVALLCLYVWHRHALTPATIPSHPTA